MKKSISAKQKRGRRPATPHEGTQRMAMPAPKPRDKDVPTSGYALIVDGHSKSIFASKDQALRAAKDLKGRFPMLQVKVYDAESKRSEEIELAAT